MPQKLDFKDNRDPRDKINTAQFSFMSSLSLGSVHYHVYEKQDGTSYLWIYHDDNLSDNIPANDLLRQDYPTLAEAIFAAENFNLE